MVGFLRLSPVRGRVGVSVERSMQVAFQEVGGSMLENVSGTAFSFFQILAKNGHYISS